METKNLFEMLEKRGYIYQTTNKDKVKEMLETPQTIYMGIDPTADSLHIGHCFPMFVLRYLQEAGHKIVILFGGATAMIGDPTGKKDMRQMVTQDFISKNLDSLKAIVGKFLKLDGENPVQFVNNYDWFKDMNYVSFMREIGVHFNVNKMLATDACKSRMEEGGLTFFEMGYTLMQAYDFVYLNKTLGCTLQIGGSDQWANIVAGTELSRKLDLQNGTQTTMEALTVPLLTNSEGNKMGKTEKGALWVDKNKTSAYEFYQAFYNQPDASTEHFLKVLTTLPLDKIATIMQGDIIAAKHKMAFEVTKYVHGEEEAIKAQTTAKNLFSGENAGENAPSITLAHFTEMPIIDFCVETKLCNSKSEARRLIEQNGIALNGEKVNLQTVVTGKDFEDGTALLKKGKKTFLKVVLDK